MTVDPVFERNGKWYHYDETWGNEHGPFDDEATARAKLDEYCRYLNGELEGQ